MKLYQYRESFIILLFVCCASIAAYARNYVVYMRVRNIVKLLTAYLYSLRNSIHRDDKTSALIYHIYFYYHSIMHFSC